VDGVRIATFEMGTGTPLLIAATPPWSHIEREIRIPAVSTWTRDLARDFRVVRYDCRGTGLSDRAPFDLSPEAQVTDMEAVADYYGLGPFAIWGSIGGSPASILFASSHPRRVSHLMLWGAYVTGASVLGIPEFRSMATVLRENWRVYTDMYAQVAFGWPDSETASQYAELMREAITHETMLKGVRQMAAIDVTEAARALRVPTLVMTRRGATISGVAEARSLAGLIPGARLSIIDGSSHAPFLENPADVTAAIRAFVAAPQTRRPAALASLTHREMQVLQLLAAGRTGKEIAAVLGVSLATAQRHTANIYAKIGARGRVEAVAYAFEHGLAASPPS
jgi:pimeloyl-ACP methyl ester carboxylesterase/DNA-binding CsgD family transcriptional regulator